MLNEKFTQIYTNLHKSTDIYLIQDKYVFHWQKLNFEHIFCGYRRMSGIKEDPGYLYQLFDVLPEQTTCEMKESTSSLQVYIQHWFHGEQGAKFM